MLEMLSKIYQKKGLALFLIINLLGVLKPYLGLDLIDPSLVLSLKSQTRRSSEWTNWCNKIKLCVVSALVCARHSTLK